MFSSITDSSFQHNHKQLDLTDKSATTDIFLAEKSHLFGL